MARILVVEDDNDNQEVITRMLQMGRHEVLLARNGEDALRVARQFHLDLILMDLSMPKMDGWTAAKTLKRHPELGQIPIIAVTSHALAGDARRAIEAGCDDYMAKPIDYFELINLVERYIAARA